MDQGYKGIWKWAFVSEARQKSYAVARVIKRKVRGRALKLLYRLPVLTRRIGNCTVCGSAAVSHEHHAPLFELARCRACDHVFSLTIPGRTVIKVAYGDFSYWETDRGHQGISEVSEGPHWDGYLKARIGILERTGVLCEGDSIFEIGCSEGMLLHQLAKRGHRVLGCEVNSAISRQGQRVLKVPIKTARFEDLKLPSHSFDLVVSFHTIEHLADPRQTVQKIVRILKSSGRVLFEVPCGPTEYDNIDHLQFFSTNSLRTLLESHFEHVEILENSYVDEHGNEGASLYGVGRTPQKNHP